MNLRLFHFVQFIAKCSRIFLELNSKGLYFRQKKKKVARCLVSTSSTKREIRHFHVVVEQRRQRNVQKSVMYVQSCCQFAYLTYCFFFLPFWLPSPSSLLELKNNETKTPCYTTGPPLSSNWYFTYVAYNAYLLSPETQYSADM